jgi:D-arabinose 1-dehydrogenase-like Zn-dependent alcohol dehydrogenase
MKTIHSFGANSIFEDDWVKPEINHLQIEVKTMMAGICRSDIGVYGGFEKAMPRGMFGHEGLGIVTKVGKFVHSVKEGDFVATISDPAYAEYYNATIGEFVKVPEIAPKYIIQPTACAINIINKTLSYKAVNIKNKTLSYKAKFQDSPILLLGSGFMSIIIGQWMSYIGQPLEVCGNNNKEIWSDMGYELKDINNLGKKYDTVIDLTSKAQNFYRFKDLVNIEGLICYAATPFEPVTTNFFDLCWNCNTIIMPSPRNIDFEDSMIQAVQLIEKGIIKPDILWTHAYKRSEYKKAFEDGLGRIPGYFRGYFDFRSE